MQVWNPLHADRWKYRTQKNRQKIPKFQWVSRLRIVTARHSSSGRQPNSAALNGGCHLYSTGRPSRWALVHILVVKSFNDFFFNCPSCTQYWIIPVHSAAALCCWLNWWYACRLNYGPIPLTADWSPKTYPLEQLNSWLRGRVMCQSGLGVVDEPCCCVFLWLVVAIWRTTRELRYINSSRTLTDVSCLAYLLSNVQPVPETCTLLLPHLLSVFMHVLYPQPVWQHGVVVSTLCVLAKLLDAVPA